MPNLLVIGCGANIHANHGAAWTQEVTIDINALNNPTHVRDITVPDDVGFLKTSYANNFDVIYFESIPAGVLSGDLNQKLIMNALDQLLRQGGRVRVRTGAAGTKQVEQIKKTFRTWAYAQTHEAARAADVISRYELAAADQGEPVIVEFRKVAGAVRKSAEV